MLSRNTARPEENHSHMWNIFSTYSLICQPIFIPDIHIIHVFHCAALIWFLFVRFAISFVYFSVRLLISPHLAASLKREVERNTPSIREKKTHFYFSYDCSKFTNCIVVVILYQRQHAKSTFSASGFCCCCCWCFYFAFRSFWKSSRAKYRLNHYWPMRYMRSGTIEKKATEQKKIICTESERQGILLPIALQQFCYLLHFSCLLFYYSSRFD